MKTVTVDSIGPLEPLGSRTATHLTHVSLKAVRHFITASGYRTRRFRAAVFHNLDQDPIEIARSAAVERYGQHYFLKDVRS